ncbi:MAG: peptidylprolyl isomerase [Caulobacteraceae bacterium]|nr:peptidylprolyl isomerase [Caulobacteraceae bacterium]
MKLWLTSILLLLAVPALSACGPKTTAEKPPVQGDRTVAMVNGRPIWASDVKTEAVAEGLIAQGEALDINSPTFRQTLDEVVDQRLLADEAVRRKLDRDPLVQRRLAAAHDRVLGSVLTDQMVETAVTPDQIQKLYEETSNAAQQSEEVKLSQIVVRTALEAAAIKNAAQKGQSFDALALQRSIDPQSRFKGGDLGGYLTLDILPIEYSNALRSVDARIGDLVGPFQTSAGFVLLKVVDRRQEAPVSLEEAKPLIVRFLTYDQVKDLLENLRGKAKVQMMLPSAPEVPGAPQEPASAPPASVPAAPPAKGALSPAANPTPSSVKPGASSLPKSAAK